MLDIFMPRAVTISPILLDTKEAPESLITMLRLPVAVQAVSRGIWFRGATRVWTAEVLWNQGLGFFNRLWLCGICRSRTGPWLSRIVGVVVDIGSGQSPARVAIGGDVGVHVGVRVAVDSYRLGMGVIRTNGQLGFGAGDRVVPHCIILE
jgi:hypothetical protein